jgi:hypothetical protein
VQAVSNKEYTLYKSRWVLLTAVTLLNLGRGFFNPSRHCFPYSVWGSSTLPTTAYLIQSTTNLPSSTYILSVLRIPDPDFCIIPYLGSIKK